MRVELLQPDAPPAAAQSPDGSDFARTLDAIGQVLSQATQAEDAYARGNGSLQDAMYGRAEADVALSVAAAAAQRAAQAVQTLMNLQI